MRSEAAAPALVASAAGNIPGVDFVSITVHEADHTLYTAAATDPIAEHADTIQYELPLGAFGAICGGWFVRRKLRRLFAHRHAVTRQAFERPTRVQPL